MAKAKAGPVVTDNGNFVIDALFDESQLSNPPAVRYTSLSSCLFFIPPGKFLLIESFLQAVAKVEIVDGRG